MNTKNLVLMALLVAVGAALYLIIPGYGEGMKPDFMLTMMFIGILLFPEKKSVFLLAAQQVLYPGCSLVSLVGLSRMSLTNLSLHL